jgi:hypothetical protein
MEALALSSYFNVFWMPDQVRHDEPGTFYECINIGAMMKTKPWDKRASEKKFCPVTPYFETLKQG